MALSKIKSTGIADSSVTSAKILDGTIANVDVNASAAIATTKLACGSNFETTTTFASKIGVVDQNIALLGFKMAVNEGLTVFNLVDGIVDEFHDESGTDEGEGSNDLYCASTDYYVNSTSPSGATTNYSAGFGVAAVSEADTSAASTNPAQGSGASGTFTVPTGVTAVDLYAYGAGGGSAPVGGAGGFAEGTLAVTATQVLHVVVGESGSNTCGPNDEGGLGGGGGVGYGSGNTFGSGGGFSGFFSVEADQDASEPNGDMYPPVEAPEVYLIAGGGGGAGGGSGQGGVGGGLVGGVGGSNYPVEASELSQSRNAGSGAGGGQTSGGQAGNTPVGTSTDGGFLTGGGQGNPVGGGGGGGGYYGGGGGAVGPADGGGGGGSSYYGHPQITSGATTTGQTTGAGESAGPSPLYPTTSNAGDRAVDGYAFVVGSAPATTTSTTIVSNAFTASSAPSTSRIVVFQENVASITLNTDIVASVSRNGGSNFTTITLADSGYVVGASGQRILTGTATISGQPSGTSMRWKLALANNAMKIHGVSLQWK